MNPALNVLERPLVFDTAALIICHCRGSFLSGSIEAVLTEEALRTAAVELFVDSAFIQSVAVIVPR